MDSSKLKLPVVSKGITLKELPGELAVFFEIGNCTQRCPGCHSKHLWLTPETEVKDLTSLKDMIRYAKSQKRRGATAIVLMGGTTNNIKRHHLMMAVRLLSAVLPVGIYSGDTKDTETHSLLMHFTPLKWLKTGSYIEALGGLEAFGRTNQELLTRASTGGWYSTRIEG